MVSCQNYVKIQLLLDFNTEYDTDLINTGLKFIDFRKSIHSMFTQSLILFQTKPMDILSLTATQGPKVWKEPSLAVIKRCLLWAEMLQAHDKA